jgi:hypothetical protein
MSKHIFDQDRPRSAMARRLDEAFAGCEEWTIAPPAPRRNTVDFLPQLSSSARMLRSAANAPTGEARAA